MLERILERLLERILSPEVFNVLIDRLIQLLIENLMAGVDDETAKRDAIQMTISELRAGELRK